MAISAIANSGPQPPTLASLLQINRVNPITGRDIDDANAVSGQTTPKSSAKTSITPKLVQDVLQTLSQLGGPLPGGKASATGITNQKFEDIKKSAVQFLTSVMTAIKPQADGQSTNASNSIEHIHAAIGQMSIQASGGLSLNPEVAQSAQLLLKSADIPSNPVSLGGLLEGLQKSLLDQSGSGSLISLTA